MRDLRIIFIYRIKRYERKGYQNEINIDYFLKNRFSKEYEGQKSVALAITTIENRAGEKLLWIDELQVIRDEDKGKGIGSYLLRQIIKNARERDLPVALSVKPGGVGGKRFNQEELTNWYAKYGFVNEGGMMILRP
ncbi:MAG: GNAT family N-acetyltransferase [Richelia sp. RM2_1_2]|nr:GNAT family N-acetyltransferase [Richelia sp. SM2_1_7]NJM22830.1 GNAT family N-acetyltransferase [Richelia sp. SM1_7_0]NJO29234.1 GNAT family N-acetyltransferase [Richelia sp. SL_2_1]NJO63849.1 GNAT family N-acetyltransferase [Richelia sp. RM2_1_2]